jgi:hypothetical protein
MTTHNKLRQFLEAEDYLAEPSTAAMKKKAAAGDEPPTGISPPKPPAGQTPNVSEDPTASPMKQLLGMGALQQRVEEFAAKLEELSQRLGKLEKGDPITQRWNPTEEMPMSKQKDYDAIFDPDPKKAGI